MLRWITYGAGTIVVVGVAGLTLLGGEVAALTSDIEQSRIRLNSEQRALTSLRTKLRTHQASYTVNGRNVERGSLTEQLHQRFERFKQGELAFASKQKLLDYLFYLESLSWYLLPPSSVTKL